jgi:hypothetical protein
MFDLWVNSLIFILIVFALQHILRQFVGNCLCTASSLKLLVF